MKLTKAEFLEKTFSIFHVSNILLQQQYRQRQFKTYSELIFVLLTIEQTNQLLLKNYDLKPVGTKVIPETNANENRNTNRFKVMGVDQDVILKGLAVNPRMTKINPSKEIFMPQIRTKARSLCRNMTMTMLTTVVA